MELALTTSRAFSVEEGKWDKKLVTQHTVNQKMEGKEKKWKLPFMLTFYYILMTMIWAQQHVLNGEMVIAVAQLLSPA